MFGNFVSQYGMELLAAILTFVGSLVGLAVKSILQDAAKDKKKRAVVKTVVEAVHQLYKDLDGEAKYEKAVEGITDMLAEKGITVTELEIKMLIESTYMKLKLQLPDLDETE